jgi:cyclophilin family peptidyl-prolyl cis-trans isomerase
MQGEPRGRRSIAGALCVLSVSGVFSIAWGCGGESSADGTQGTVTTQSTSVLRQQRTPLPTVDCKPAHLPKFESPTYSAPAQTVKWGEKLTAIVTTSCGSFEIALDSKRNPAIVNSFVFLARKGFYDGLPFDRAAQGTYLHGGKPSGGAIDPGYSVKGKVPEGFIYRQAVVAMDQPYEAPAGSRAGSQFFVSLAKPWIDMFGIYAPLGTVVKGLDVLVGISAFGPPQPSGPRNAGVLGRIGKLQRTVVIKGIEIKQG